MDIAVFSDIHGNYVAFEQCLEYALGRNIDTFLLLGDYLGEFPYPQKTMEMLYMLKEKYCCFFVKGNKEDYWINRKADKNCGWKDGNLTVGAMKYCYDNLTERDIEFFQGFSIAQEIRFQEASHIMICHGSPNKNNEAMLPGHGQTYQTMEECPCRYILCGHTHIQRVIAHGGKVVLNPGAVGVPLHSGGKAQFMILHQNMREWAYEFVDIDYDKRKVIREMRESGLEKAAPYWMQITKHLMLTGEVSHKAVLTRAMQLYEEETGESSWYNVPDQYWEKAIDELLT